MLLSAIDPALLFYKLEDWQDRKAQCFSRLRALVLHFRETREYGQEIAMSDNLEGLIYKFFPWSADSKSISELRDLRNFVLNDIQRVERVDTGMAGDIDLQPAGVVCEYVETPEVIDAWKELLCGCVGEVNSYKPQIATWVTPAVRQYKLVSLTILNSEAETQARFDLPLVWDDNSWAMQLAKQDWWPDLQRCVELEFKSNPAIRSHSMVREEPMPFRSSREFRDSLDRFCRDKQLQRSLVEALTKKVYGIHDVGLGDEQMEEIRRFRVTRFWRVHYRMEDGQIVLLEFRPH